MGTDELHWLQYQSKSLFKYPLQTKMGEENWEPDTPHKQTGHNGQLSKIEVCFIVFLLNPNSL